AEGQDEDAAAPREAPVVEDDGVGDEELLVGWRFSPSFVTGMGISRLGSRNRIKLEIARCVLEAPAGPSGTRLSPSCASWPRNCVEQPTFQARPRPDEASKATACRGRPRAAATAPRSRLVQTRNTVCRA